MYIRDRAIILKKEPFREHDRRYVMYGRSHGLLIAVARGSSVRTSKQAGHLEPLSETDVMIAVGKTFDKLAVATRAYRPCSLQSCGTFTTHVIAGGVADVICRLIRPGVSDSRIYEMLRELIQSCANIQDRVSSDRASLLYAASILRLLDMLGFAPPLNVAASGTTPVPSLALVACMRRFSFVDLLRITAPKSAIEAAIAFVMEALKQTHLEREPHGLRMIRVLF